MAAGLPAAVCAHTMSSLGPPWPPRRLLRPLTVTTLGQPLTPGRHPVPGWVTAEERPPRPAPPAMGARRRRRPWRRGARGAPSCREERLGDRRGRGRWSQMPLGVSGRRDSPGPGPSQPAQSWFLPPQGASRATDDAERERRDREERLRHSRNPATRGLPSTASGRLRGTQEVAPPTPLTPTSHTGESPSARQWAVGVVCVAAALLARAVWPEGRGSSPGLPLLVVIPKVGRPWSSRPVGSTSTLPLWLLTTHAPREPLGPPPTGTRAWCFWELREPCRRAPAGWRGASSLWAPGRPRPRWA